MPTCPRSHVYAVIDGERRYQEGLPAERRAPGPKKTAEYLTLLAAYVGKAQETWAGRAGEGGALHEVRKIAALAVACLEENGCLAREGFGAEGYADALSNARGQSCRLLREVAALEESLRAQSANYVAARKEADQANLELVRAREEKDRADRLRVQLDGCLAAAEGRPDPKVNRGSYGWSPAYEAVAKLRRTMDAGPAQCASRLIDLQREVEVERKTVEALRAELVRARAPVITKEDVLVAEAMCLKHAAAQPFREVERTLERDVTLDGGPTFRVRLWLREGTVLPHAYLGRLPGRLREAGASGTKMIADQVARDLRERGLTAVQVIRPSLGQGTVVYCVPFVDGARGV